MLSYSGAAGSVDSDSSAFNALPRMMGISSPGNLYPVNSSLQLQLHQLQQLLVVHHVDLVQVHHHRRHFHLPRQQHVLPCLGHGPVRRAHHQDRPIHLGRARDHVLDVVRVPRAVHVRVVPLVRLVLHVGDGDRDAPLPLLRRLVDLVERREVRLPLHRQRLRDRRRQRRLPVVHVTNRPHVHVRLVSYELLLGHGRCFLRVMESGSASISTRLNRTG